MTYIGSGSRLPDQCWVQLSRWACYGIKPLSIIWDSIRRASLLRCSVYRQSRDQDYVSCSENRESSCTFEVSISVSLLVGKPRSARDLPICAASRQPAKIFHCKTIYDQYFTVVSCVFLLTSNSAVITSPLDLTKQINLAAIAVSENRRVSLHSDVLGDCIAIGVLESIIPGFFKLSPSRFKDLLGTCSPLQRRWLGEAQDEPLGYKLYIVCSLPEDNGIWTPVNSSESWWTTTYCTHGILSHKFYCFFFVGLVMLPSRLSCVTAYKEDLLQVLNDAYLPTSLDFPYGLICI